MEERRLSCSKDWTVLTINGTDKKTALHLNYTDIESIHFDEAIISKMFRKIQTHRIQIFVKNAKSPIVFTRYHNQKYFDEYKHELSKFARDNRIKLNDLIFT